VYRVPWYHGTGSQSSHPRACERCVKQLITMYQSRYHCKQPSQDLTKTCHDLLGLTTSHSHNPGDPEKGERSSLTRVLARTPFNSCVRASYLFAFARCAPPRPAATGSRRVGGRRCSQPSLHSPSTCARLSPRVLTRARYGGAALGLSSSGQLVPAARIDGAECARVLCRCGGEGADAARCAAQPAPNVVPRPAA